MTRTVATAPADWAELAPTLSINAARKRWRRNIKTLHRWAAESGVAMKAYEQPKRLMPSDFAAMHATMSVKALAKHYRTSTAAVVRWCRDAGIGRRWGVRSDRTEKKTAEPRPVVLRQRSSPLVARGVRDPSHAGQAADYLRRYGPVARCDANGRYNERGTHYRRNATVLTAAEIIERAERLGFDPHAWSRIAA